jgi:hypothetical protein
LINVRDIHHRVEFAKRDVRAGFLLCFAFSPLVNGFGELHEASRQGPSVRARFNRTQTQQNFVIPDGECAHHESGVLIMHRTAGFTHIPFAIVAFEKTARNRRRALSAEFLQTRGGEVEVGIVAHRPLF